jgi:SAM-dependent methyltransferase
MNTDRPSIDWKNYYNREHEIYRFVPEHDPAETWRVEFVKALLPSAPLARVLDAGCGDGYQCQYLASRYPRVVGCDIALPRLQFARQRSPAIPFFAAELMHPPLRPQAFDLVTLVEVLEHMPEPLAVLKHLAGLSRRYVLVTVPHKQKPVITLCPHCLQSFPLDGHLHEFDEDKLRDLLTQAGLRVIKIDKFVPPAAWESAALIRWLPRAGKEALRRLLQSCGLVARNAAIFLGALCEVP